MIPFISNLIPIHYRKKPPSFLLSSSFIYVFGLLCLRMALVGADTCTELVKVTIFTYNKCVVIDFILFLTEKQTAFMCQKQTVKTGCYRQTNSTVQHENEKPYSDVTKNAFCWDMTPHSVAKFTTVSQHITKFIPYLSESHLLSPAMRITSLTSLNTSVNGGPGM